MERTELLVIGAGPYSLATTAYAKSLGVDVTVVGKPLDFWKTNMPRGMFLRSGPDWHLDARDVATFEAYVNGRGLTRAETKPVSLDTFLDYASWFMGQYNVTPHPAYVTHLVRSNGGYVATLDDGSYLSANKVLLGLGLTFFKDYPSELVEKLPPGSYAHTCDTVDFDFYRNKRILIVGGRQSAFEWAALIREHGAEEIHITHRHATPHFVERDWSWVQPMARRTLVGRGSEGLFGIQSWIALPEAYEEMEGPRYIWWNFVSSRREWIEQAKEDWKTGRFTPVPGETEFIPLPES